MKIGQRLQPNASATGHSTMALPPLPKALLYADWPAATRPRSTIGIFSERLPPFHRLAGDRDVLRSAGAARTDDRRTGPPRGAVAEVRGAAAACLLLHEFRCTR